METWIVKYANGSHTGTYVSFITLVSSVQTHTRVCACY